MFLLKYDNLCHCYYEDKCTKKILEKEFGLTFLVLFWGSTSIDIKYVLSSVFGYIEK